MGTSGLPSLGGTLSPLAAFLGTWPVLLALSAVLLGALVYKLRWVLIDPYTTPLRNLPGPPSQSWLFGHFKEFHLDPQKMGHDRWFEEYHTHSLLHRGLLYVRY